MTLNNTTTGGTYYAIQSKTITIEYAGNGATSGSTSSSTCTMYNSNTTCSITLRSNGFTRTNYSFEGWGTSTTTKSYNAGQSVSFSSNTTLYAIWKVNYICSAGTLTQNSSYSSSTEGYICVGEYNDGSGAVEKDTSCNKCEYEITVNGKHSSCGYATCEYETTINGKHSSCGYATCEYETTVNGKDSSCGYATCDYVTKTSDYNCSRCGSYTYYYCPSGWTEYSGSGSSLKCYKAAKTN